jgi:hypothetical protein
VTECVGIPQGFVRGELFAADGTSRACGLIVSIVVAVGSEEMFLKTVLVELFLADGAEASSCFGRPLLRVGDAFAVLPSAVTTVHCLRPETNATFGTHHLQMSGSGLGLRYA